VRSGCSLPCCCRRRSSPRRTIARGTITKSLVACVGRATKAFRACTLRGGASCGDEPAVGRAGARLRRKVVADCTDTTIRDAGHPPPFEPSVLAARLDATCRGGAATLVMQSVDTLGGTEPRRCLAVLTAVSTRLAVRTLAENAGCVLAADGCRPTRVAARIAAIERKARKAAMRACDTTLGEDGVAGALARVRARTTCTLAQALPAFATCAPSGVETLVDLWHLPMPRAAGARVGQISSYDRTGGNADLGIGSDTAPLLANLGLPVVELDFSYLYRDGDRFVVFDEVGPGVVWRIWMTGLDGLVGGGLAGDVAVELDGEAVPRAQLARADLFAGTHAPFLAPLAGDSLVSSGGFYAVVPIPFTQRLRITTSTVPNWLQITFTRLPPDQAVASFDPSEDTTAAAALLAKAGDPSTTVEPTEEDELDLAVPPGATKGIWTRPAGGGTVVRLELIAPADEDLPTGLRLRGIFDDAAAPQIDAPLDDLFGAALGPGARSIGFGRDGGRYYCYFPMPFREHADLELRNDGVAAFEGWRLRIGTVDTIPLGPLTYLHATANAAHVDADGQDFVLLERTGAGHVVGVVMTAGCGAVGQCQLANLPGLDGAHLEGDERIAIDGSRWPQWHGTGLEDFFGGGFYFVRGAFTLPTHGNPARCRPRRRDGRVSICEAPTASSWAMRSRTSPASASRSSTDRRTTSRPIFRASSFTTPARRRCWSRVIA
jgi:hypothetical protein